MESNDASLTITGDRAQPGYGLAPGLGGLSPDRDSLKFFCTVSMWGYPKGTSLLCSGATSSEGFSPKRAELCPPRSGRSNGAYYLLSLYVEYAEELQSFFDKTQNQLWSIY